MEGSRFKWTVACLEPVLIPSLLSLLLLLLRLSLWSHSQQYTSLFLFLKKCSLNFWETERCPIILLILFFFFLSFCDAVHLFNCRLPNGWDSGPVIEHPLTALPPLRLPALPMRTVPIPSVIPLARRVWIETYCTASGEKKGDSKMRP